MSVEHSSKKCENKKKERMNRKMKWKYDMTLEIEQMLLKYLKNSIAESVIKLPLAEKDVMQSMRLSLDSTQFGPTYKH